MAKLGKEVSTKGKTGLADFSAIPGGKYLAEIRESRAEKTDRGKRAVFIWTILKGEFKGRKIFVNANYGYGGEAAAMAEKIFTSMVEATGTSEKIEDTKQFHKIPCWITVTVQKQEGYNDSNQIQKYESKNADSSDKKEKGGKKKDKKKSKKTW